MKRMYAIIVMLFSILMISESFAQVSTINVDFGTMQNSVTKTKYVKLPDNMRIDSITVSLFGLGELDVDSVDIYVGAVKSAGDNPSEGYYGSTAYTCISTVDLAASTKGFQALIPSTGNTTILSSGVLRGVDALKIVTRGSTSGCAAGNNAWVKLKVYGVKL